MPLACVEIIIVVGGHENPEFFEPVLVVPIALGVVAG